MYDEACQLTAYLCKIYNIDPLGQASLPTKQNSIIQVPTILCHGDAASIGVGCAHVDVNHWFPKFNKSMETFRQDVYKILTNNQEKIEEEEEEMTQEQFNMMMDEYLRQLALKEGSSWSQASRAWTLDAGIIQGDASGNAMWRKFLTREEAAQLIYRMTEGLRK